MVALTMVASTATAIPRPPNQQSSSAVPPSSLPTSLRKPLSKPQASSPSSPVLPASGYSSRPDSSASTAPSRIVAPKVSASLTPTSRAQTSSSVRSGSYGSGLQSPPSLTASGAASKPSAVPSGSGSSNRLRKKVSIASFPQPPGSASTQRAAPYVAVPPDLLHPQSPTKSPITRPSIASGRPGSRMGNLRTSLPRASPSTNALSKSFDGFSTSSVGHPSPAILPDAADSNLTPPVQENETPDHEKSKSKESKGNVIISVRVRPDVGASPDSSKSDVEWLIDGRRSVVAYRGREGGEYIYDNVFTAHDNNARVYDAAAKRLVRRVMEGYHGTVFAYGMTGTGKTFSMQGTATSPGVIPLAITDIFAFIRETPHREFLLRVSYLEIYNEKIFDLLSANPGTNTATGQDEIKLREDSRRGVYATPLKEEIVQSPTQLLRVIARGDNARRTAGTQYNARSSRSHAVVQIVVESRQRAGGGSDDHKRSATAPGGVRVSTLSLIDLAGSEKAADSKERRTEGAHINKSLLTLGTVISRLSNEKDAKEGGRHLPYRDSKLTRLLQPALSGNSLVSILCTIHLSTGVSASSQSQVNETLNTLKFASRAKNNIISHAKRCEEALPGEPGSRALLDRYRTEIAELRRQLEEQKVLTKKSLSGRQHSSLSNGRDSGEACNIIDPQKERERMRKEDEENQRRHAEQMLEMQLARTALKERIEHLNRLILSSKSLGVNTSLPFDRSQSSLSMRNQSALAMSSASSFIGLGVSRGVSSRLSGNSLDLSVLRSPSTADSYSVQTPCLHGSGYPASSFSLTEYSPQFRDPPRPISTTPSTDSLGSNGDGTASFAAQIRALQADLADRNRYIDTLERRLLHARRTSQTKALTSSFGAPALCPSCREGAANGVEVILREKDDEIRDLKSRLDDKDKMCNVLRSVARRGLVFDSPGVNVSGLNLSSSSTSSPPSIPLPPLTTKRDSLSSLPSVSGRRASGTNTYRSSKTTSRPSMGANPAGKRVYFPPSAGTNHESLSGSASPIKSTGGKASVSFTDDRERTPLRSPSVDEMTTLLNQMLSGRRRAHVTSTASLPVSLTSSNTSDSAITFQAGSHASSTPRPSSLPIPPDSHSVKEDRIDSGIVMEG